MKFVFTDTPGIEYRYQFVRLPPFDEDNALFRWMIENFGSHADHDGLPRYTYAVTVGSLQLCQIGFWDQTDATMFRLRWC